MPTDIPRRLATYDDLPITEMNMNTGTVFDKDISLHWHCEARDHVAISDLLSTLADPRHQLRPEEFQQMLARAIRECRYSVQDYEALTGLDFETVDEVAQDLRQLWRQLYGDAEQP